MGGVWCGSAAVVDIWAKPLGRYLATFRRGSTNRVKAVSGTYTCTLYLVPGSRTDVTHAKPVSPGNSNPFRGLHFLSTQPGRTRCTMRYCLHYDNSAVYCTTLLRTSLYVTTTQIAEPRREDTGAISRDSQHSSRQQRL